MTTTATGPAPGATLTGATGTTGASKPTGAAELRPAAIFSHRCVLQRRAPIPIFGTGAPGRTVVVQLTAGESPDLLRSANGDATDSLIVTTTIGDDGRWCAYLPALEAGDGYQLTIRDHGDVTLVYQHVAIGEVWLAAGQSNIELELRNADDAARTVADSADPLLRFFNTPKSGHVDADLLRAEDASAWLACGPETSGTMSAVAYWFAHRLRQTLGARVPVGIVDCYVGGTSISCWLDEPALRSLPAGRGYLERYHAQVDGKTLPQMHRETDEWQRRFDAWNAAIAQAQAAEPGISWDTLNARYGECPWPPPMTTFSQYHPTGPFHAMVERVAPYALAGVLWYQGEEDEPYCGEYRAMLGLLIERWRNLWGAPLPFMVAQLPQWIAKADHCESIDRMLWPVIREAQWDASQTIPGVSTAVLMDCGEFNNIHPTDKRTPGERLADLALARVYDVTAARRQEAPTDAAMEPLEVDGPLVSGAVRADPHADAGTVRLRFAHADGLRFHGTTPGGSDPADDSPTSRTAANSGFAMAGADGAFHQASAAIAADAPDCVDLRCPDVPHPIHARYGWFSWGPAPLVNAAGLPAVPFRDIRVAAPTD